MPWPDCIDRFFPSEMPAKKHYAGHLKSVQASGLLAVTSRDLTAATVHIIFVCLQFVAKCIPQPNAFRSSIAVTNR